jgi:hypothetical protein
MRLRDLLERARQASLEKSEARRGDAKERNLRIRRSGQP